jgi:hypothetical protein
VRWEVAVSGVLAPSGELSRSASLSDVVRVARDAYSQRLVASVGNEHELGGVSSRVRRDLEVVFAGSLKDVVRLSLTKHVVRGFQPPS